MSEKQKDFDVKLQQMVLDREKFKTTRTPKIHPDLVDFKTGNLNQSKK